MARDRQRAKQRRNKRQAGAGGPSRAARARSARERRQPGDVDWEETEAQAEPGAETDDATALDGDDATALDGDDAADAPDPLEHSSAAVDEARLAEAGVPPIDADEVGASPIEEDELERAPDEVEGDLVPRRRGRHVAGEEDEAAPARAEAHTRSRGRVLTFLGHSWDELKRVQWPDRRQVGQGTAVTLGFVVLAGGYLGLLDAIWKPLIQAIL